MSYIIPLAQDHIEIARSANPQSEWLYSPHILTLNCGRIVASYDVSCKNCYVKVSDDGGTTWIEKHSFVLYHARLFLDGERVYILGHDRNSIRISYSDDNGETWSELFQIGADGLWHQAPCSVCYSNGYVYLVMEEAIRLDSDDPPFGNYWVPNILGLVVMRGKLGSDLTKEENWLFSNTVRFRDIIKNENELEWFGIPFLKDAWLPENQVGTMDAKEYQSHYDYEKDEEGIPFYTHPIGWLETNIVQIRDPHHFWYDKTGKTFHLFSRGHTAGSGYCCVMKAVERIRDGKEVIDIECEKVPSGKKILFLPMPGGQMKFYILYDKKTKLYWLLSTQATDTMCRIEHFPENRYNIPCDERDRLALHFSKNMVDWVFAGLVAKSGNSGQARHYASMDIDGEDLIIASRSGDKDALNAHCGNLITFHRIKNFRELVY